jgi:hypothetical protein
VDRPRVGSPYAFATDMVARSLCVLSLAGALGCATSTATSPDAAARPDADRSIFDASGATGDAGKTGDAAPTCLTGTVSFDLRLAAGSTGTYCLGAPGSCTDAWLSILTADGGETLSLVYGCVPDCSDCQPVACPLICAIPLPLSDAGAHMAWNGTFVEHQTCGASLACTRNACAPAGNYVARMCGYREAPDASSALPECIGSSTPTCTDVTFVWPPPSGTSSVAGVIAEGNADAGASD